MLAKIMNIIYSYSGSFNYYSDTWERYKFKDYRVQQACEQEIGNANTSYATGSVVLCDSSEFKTAQRN